MDVMIYKKKIKQKFSIPSSQKISIYSLGDTDELAMSLGKLVLDGTKKASTSGYRLYESGPIPKKGDISIITDNHHHPLCTIRNTAVKTVKFSDMTEDEVRKEGESDLSLASWKEDHRQFLTPYYQKYLGIDFTEDEMVVHEEFEVIDVYEKSKKTNKS